MKFLATPMKEYTISRQRRDFEEALPPPLPKTSKDRNFHAFQPQSSLLSLLPSEIRTMIWQYVVGAPQIHIVSKYQRLGHTICDAHYWQQHHAERPDLRASSYMYTYGSLPTTKQMADVNLCDMMVTCQQMYQEIAPSLYSASTFVFFDLRTISVFKSSILPKHWGAIRSVDIYAMFYRKDDMKDAVEAKAQLELEAWPGACSALTSLPNLQRVTIFIGNARYLDAGYLLGGRKMELHEAVARFLMRCKVKRGLEVVFAGKKSGWGGNGEQRWDLLGLTKEEVGRLGREQSYLV